MKEKLFLDSMESQEIKALITEGKIDVTTLPEELLQRLLDYETDLLFCDSADMELIRTYSRQLEVLRGDSLKTPKTTAVIIAEAKEKKDQCTKKVIKKRLPKAKLIAVAAILSATACLGIATTAEPSYRTIANQYVMSRPVGTTIELDKTITGSTDVTVTHNEPSVWYDSTEELLAAIDEDIYYPTKFPNGKEPVNFFSSIEFGYKTATVSLYDAEVCFNVTFDYHFTEDKVKAEKFDIYEAHGKKIYFDKKDKGGAFFFDNGNYYCITTPFRQAPEEIIFVIDNLTKG
ncbi:MAG: hypothetical protein E7597_04170 [Ruminococcaceae bacterium]|nr:hypothetical protein [Oscillospiraceae bacterium]